MSAVPRWSTARNTGKGNKAPIPSAQISGGRLRPVQKPGKPYRIPGLPDACCAPERERNSDTENEYLGCGFYAYPLCFIYRAPENAPFAVLTDHRKGIREGAAECNPYTKEDII